MSNLFTRAKAYCKSHPRTTYQEAIQLLSKKGKVSGKRKISPRTANTSKIKVKVRKTKAGNTNLVIDGIAGLNLQKVKQELHHQARLTKCMQKHQTAAATKGMPMKEKAQHRNQVKHYRNAIAASKKHVSALKRSI